ncbi:MAG: membrane protein insertase YidC [Hyphomicrobiales bacterium]
MDENRNYLLAIALSLVILVGWQFFIAGPKIEAQRQRAAIEAQQNEQAAPAPQGQTGEAAPSAVPQAQGESGAPAVPAGPAANAPTTGDRTAALAADARIVIDTPALSGSLNLKGGRIDDIRLKNYHETVDPKSPTIELLSPAGSANPYYADFGWVADTGTTVALPGPETLWTVESGDKLEPGKPLVIAHDNGQGVVFRRTITLDERYMFTVVQSVENGSGQPMTLYPYGLLSRQGTPHTTGYYILHEGLIGVLGEEGLTEVKYKDIKEKLEQTHRDVGRGWIGITDKYWAAVLFPDDTAQFDARFTYRQRNGVETYQTDYLGKARTIAAGEKGETTARLFAGAKEVAAVDGYETQYKFENFDLLIDWGWFYFFTKPLFYIIDWLFKMFGNFGVAILLVTVLVKAIFFPLANKSYVSMSRMKKVQPLMKELQDRFKDDKMRQQQALMELYKKEKINPLSGCLPIVVQIPVFFALYKVLFITIEMRHAPFFGWIHDLAAPDPTTLFNLFGLIPWTPPQMLMIGIWPLIMGVTMFLQMKLNPAPTDPVQASIFTWMPVIFTFILGSFPAGLVIYWSWNNFLSIVQQMTIMKRQGVKIELWDNLAAMLKRGAKDTTG